MDKSKLYASNIADNWDELPQTLKLVQATPKVSFTVSEEDEEFINLIKPFAGKDELRPTLMGIYFDDDCVVATDTHKLVTIPNTSKYRGYALVKTNDKYVNYSAVIPEVSQLNHIRKFNITKLRTYIKSIIAGKYTNPITFQSVFKIDDLVFGMNVKFLDNALDFFQKLGEETIYIGSKNERMPFVFCADKSFDFKKHPLVLVMPVMIKEEYNILGARDLDLNKQANYYFDFSDSEIHNKGGAVADFNAKLTEADKLPFNMDFAPVIKKLMGNRYIEILNYVCVENGIIRATNLTSSFYCKIYGDVPNGIYQFVSDTLIQNPSQDISDFPTDNFENPENRIVTNNDFIQNAMYVGKMAGDDVFREYILGVNLKIENGNVRICGSDNIRFFYNTIKCESNSDFEVTISPEDLIYYFQGIKKNDPTKISFGNRFFVENSESKFIGEVIQKKFVDYLKFIKDSNENFTDGTKSIQFNKQELFKLLKDKKIQIPKTQSIMFFKNPDSDSLLDVYYGFEDKTKIGTIKGSVTKQTGNFISLDRASILMPTDLKLNPEISFQLPYLRYFLSITQNNEVKLNTALNSYSACFIDFNDLKLSKPASSPKSAPKTNKKKIEIVEAVEVVEQKPEAPKKVRVPKPKAEKPKPVEVEKPKMDEKFKILLNSELPAYMLSSINELGKKTNGFTEFNETTKAGSEKLVQLVKDFLANKDIEEKQSVTKEVTKEVTKPDTKEEAPAMPKKNKDKLIAISKKIKLSLKYLKGDSKIKQQKVVKTLELAIKYLK
jgi:hypothetical protein